MFAIALVFFGCGEHHETALREPPLETAIARELTGRFASPATASCDVFARTPTCSAEVLGVELPIRITSDGKAWVWTLDGHFIDTRPIAPYIDAMLRDLHVAQTASCGAPIRRLAPGERLTCMLSGGGRAFVELAADGTPRVELALDRDSAATRDEPMTPERARELDQKSRALEQQLDVEDP